MPEEQEVIIEVNDNRPNIGVVSNEVTIEVGQNTPFENVQNVNTSGRVMVFGDNASPDDGDFRFFYDSVTSQVVVQTYNASVPEWQDGDFRANDVTTSPSSLHLSDAWDISSGGVKVNYKDLNSSKNIITGQQRMGDHSAPATETVDNSLMGTQFSTYMDSTGTDIPAITNVDFISLFLTPIGFVNYKVEFVTQEALINEELTYFSWYSLDDSGINIIKQKLTVASASVGDTIEWLFRNPIFVEENQITRTEIRKKDGTLLLVSESTAFPTRPYVKLFFRFYENKSVPFTDQVPYPMIWSKNGNLPKGSAFQYHGIKATDAKPAAYARKSGCIRGIMITRTDTDLSDIEIYIDGVLEHTESTSAIFTTNQLLDILLESGESIVIKNSSSGNTISNPVVTLDASWD